MRPAFDSPHQVLPARLREVAAPPAPSWSLGVRLPLSAGIDVAVTALGRPKVPLPAPPDAQGRQEQAPRGASRTPALAQGLKPAAPRAGPSVGDSSSSRCQVSASVIPSQAQMPMMSAKGKIHRTHKVHGVTNENRPTAATTAGLARMSP